MAKGQMRSNKEAKKPKADKKAPKVAASAATTPAASRDKVKFGKGGLVTPKR